MILSAVFSTALYQIASSELHRSLRAPTEGVVFQSGLFLETEGSRKLRQERYEEGITSIIANLVILNTITLVAGGGISYVLARRTLRPVQEAMEAQGRFTSDASHELRTPLAVMKSEIEVGLRDRSATKQGYRKLLESNLEEVDRLRELSDRLLMLASDKTLPLTTGSLDTVAIDAVSHVVKQAQQKNISVTNEVSPADAAINTEALADAVTILLENAIKYSPDNTTVRLTSEEKNRSLLLHVKDEGPGITPQDKERIFDRFYRADSSRTRGEIEGHGLGLSIAKRIVEQHHGQLSVTSTEKGSVFTIRLPKP
jgi:signal transduction histidine kinase